MERNIIIPELEHKIAEVRTRTLQAAKSARVDGYTSADLARISEEQMDTVLPIFQELDQLSGSHPQLPKPSRYIMSFAQYINLMNPTDLKVIREQIRQERTDILRGQLRDVFTASSVNMGDAERDAIDSAVHLMFPEMKEDESSSPTAL
jgi:hypothetical protein